MDKELEKIKAMILEQTRHMEDKARVELLDELAWWASETAGSMNYEAPDIDNYDE